jgi:hypothetical protein
MGYPKQPSSPEHRALAERHLVEIQESNRLRKRLDALLTLRPLSELHEDDGPVLLWRVPVDEPPHVGSVCDSDWSHLQTYYTHWSPLPRVRETGKEG